MRYCYYCFYCYYCYYCYYRYSSSWMLWAASPFLPQAACSAVKYNKYEILCIES
jgi:hypothetical protein